MAFGAVNIPCASRPEVSLHDFILPPEVLPLPSEPRPSDSGLLYKYSMYHNMTCIILSCM